MLFNSFNFIVFFPFIFLFYWLLPARWRVTRKIFLILVSYGLYMCFDATYSAILLGVTLVTYGGGNILEKEIKYKKIIIWLTTILSLLPLLLFKYHNFVSDTLNDWLRSVGFSPQIPGLNWAIPVGISFYTFQAIGYVLDVYHGRYRAEKNFIDYVLFVSFFPQIVSGPISKAEDLLPQIKKEHSFDYNKSIEGLKTILWGLFMKVVVADRAGIYADMIFSNYAVFSGLNCFLGSILYSIQIYTDFCGYSLMAVGVGRLLGYELINNFNRPYFASTITSFWKRWHISLTKWLTQNIYIPLGGNRVGKLKTYWNILITFLVSGIWHGANWTYIIWGLIHGGIQIIEKSLGLNNVTNNHIKPLRIIITFLIVNFAWIIFRSPSIDSAGMYISQIFSGGGFNSKGIETLAFLAIGVGALFIKEFMQEYFPKFYNRVFELRFFRWIVYMLILASILLLGVFDGGQFIYSNF